MRVFSFDDDRRERIRLRELDLRPRCSRNEHADEDQHRGQHARRLKPAAQPMLRAANVPHTNSGEA